MICSYGSQVPWVEVGFDQTCCLSLGNSFLTVGQTISKSAKKYSWIAHSVRPLSYLLQRTLKESSGKPLTMNIEIHKPDLAHRVRAQMQSDHFKDADELIEKALDALDEQASLTVPEAATGAVVLAALQASPYRDIDLTPPRVRLANARDVVL